MWGGGISGCAAAAKLTPATTRRLLADLKRLHEEPIALAAAAPCSDKDLTLWNGVIGVEMDVTDIGHVTVPLHFLIDFPADYPQSAPNIGFSFEFRYSGGAEYVMPDGRLKGKKVICLDVLGNFGGIHTEWKNSVGSGWSPAYTVTTLLIQLQSVLCDLGSGMSQQERNITYQSAVRFCEKNPSAMLELLDEDEVHDLCEQRRAVAKLARVCGGDTALVERVEAFAAQAGFSRDPDRMEAFVALLADMARGPRAGGNVSESPAGSTAVAEVDSNICCFSTGKLYTEALLGVGISRAQKNLTTMGDLLSKEAFDGGLRQSTNKTPFEFFLPVWINEVHAGQNKVWRETLQKTYTEIGNKVFQTREEDEAILEVFPRLISQIIVEMMRPDQDKSTAIATFEALCNVWRTMRWLVDTRSKLRSLIARKLSDFATKEDRRHKDVTPDLGVVLVLFTVFQGHADAPSRSQFIDAYLDENSLRWVMWWQKDRVPNENTAVFKATQVSREICMFQMMVVDIAIGDPAVALRQIETTNCKLPDRLESLQSKWREQKAATTTWGKYFEHIGATRPNFPSTQHWIESCVSRAAMKGPRYQHGGGGKGKGKGGGKGRGY